MTSPTASGVLGAISALPIYGPESLTHFGTTLVAAPHQDDETLGCGGLIALLREREMPVRVVFTSDGTGSHPNSLAYPPDALRDLREHEALEATRILGIDARDVSFLRLPDTSVPHPRDHRFHDAVRQFREAANLETVDTLLVPWRRDPHSDHRATWHIVSAALQEPAHAIRVVEYPIWVWDLSEPGDLPQPGEARGWRLDISSVLHRKLAAIDTYRSQITDLIADDPDGFRLQAETLAHFRHGYEVYLEACNE
jgi:LmbE family N-acetylglucosaminyl deacetylase